MRIDLRARESDLGLSHAFQTDNSSVPFCDADIAESAARLRGRYGLKLPDAIQLASALSINADALVTHDRDFANVSGLPILA